MNVPYFSIITTPGSLIGWILFMLFAISVSSLVYLIMCKGEIGKLKLLLVILITTLYVLSLVWLFIGDSTSWSEPIGLWLRGK